MPPSDFDSFCAIHSTEISEIAKRFSDYEPQQVHEAVVIAWLRQFQAQHRALALKVAQNIRYYSIDRIHGLMRTAHGTLKAQLDAIGVGWNHVILTPRGTIGESGPDIARRFRNVNQLHRNQAQFVETHKLAEAIYDVDDPVVVFLDDFIGTGKQVSDAWSQVLVQIVPDYVPMYLLVVAAFGVGIERVENETPMKVLPVHMLGGKDTLTSTANLKLSNSDKSVIQNYCVKADNHPLGFGKLAAIVSFAYCTPNNTISIIRGSENQSPWKGLLPRWEDLGT